MRRQPEPPRRLELIVIRHAVTAWNTQGRYQGALDPDLSPGGVTQARALGSALEVSARACEVIWTSDLRRAWRTAELAFPGRRPIREPRLRELDFGLFDGHTFEENLRRHPDRFPKWLADPRRIRPPRGETLDELEDRIGSWLERRPAGRIAVVTHAGPIHTLLARALRLPFSEARARFPLEPGHALRLGLSLHERDRPLYDLELLR